VFAGGAQWRAEVGDMRFAWAACVVMILIAGCKPQSNQTSAAVEDEKIKTGPAASAPWFERVTEKSGVQFNHLAGTSYAMPDQIASGVALLDFDRDGILDLYLVQNTTTNGASGNQLYRGELGAKFRNVSEGCGLDVKGPGMNAIAGDVNNDGWPDVVVAEYGATRVFVNQGGKNFKEVSGTCGVDNPRWAVAASFVDFDRDGWLDLVIGNYVDYDPSQVCNQPNGQRDFCAPSSFPPTVSRLWRNATKAKGGEPVFEDWTVRSGIARTPGMALGVVCADFTGDHWPDIFFADDGRPNRLFVNQRNGTFSEEAALRGLAYNVMGRTAANMGVAYFDPNRDGKADLFVTHLADEFHSFFRQQEAGQFLDAIAQSGIQEQGWRGTAFGVVAADFDLDGWPDLAIANGLIRRSPAAQKPVARRVNDWWSEYAQRQQIFKNTNGNFSDVSEMNSAFCGEASIGRGLSVGDLDNDGAPDLVLGNAQGPVEIFKNVAPRSGHWVKIRLVEPEFGDRDSIGAEIQFFGANQKWWAVLQPATSYAASSGPALHFGLGEISNIERAEVTWPNGEIEKFSVGEVDRVVTLKRGAGQK
jgi:enediyne biosynthesis protein E4